LGCATAALAQDQAPNAKLVQVELGRMEGVFAPTPTFMRSIVLSSSDRTPNGTALLWFRGWPGLAQIKDASDWKERGNLNFFLKSLDVLLQEGITFVLMDCPSDQWGLAQGHPQRCNDSYRESPLHAEDVRQMMGLLKAQENIQRFVIMGHSYGSISSRWLAMRLDREIEGSIHSASMTGPVRVPMERYGASVPRMDMSKLTSPYLFLHHENDACATTSYATIRSMFADHLISLRGGSPFGDVCGGKHYHSYGGIEVEAAQAVLEWMKQRTQALTPR
jgi:alpha/beta superfamily hydrolase